MTKDRVYSLVCLAAAMLVAHRGSMWSGGLAFYF